MADRHNADLWRCPLSRRHQGHSGHQKRSATASPLGAQALCSRLCKLLRAHHLDANEALIALDSSVVARGDAVQHSRLEGFLGAVVQSDRNAPGDRMADVSDLAAICSNDWLDALRPLPPWLEN